MKQHFKGMIWPRGKHKSGVYRYAIVGMIVTDEPIKEFEGKNELFADSPSFTLADSLANLRTREPAYNAGDATNVMLSLDTL
jgi:hypothetical protein